MDRAAATGRAARHRTIVLGTTLRPHVRRAVEALGTVLAPDEPLAAGAVPPGAEDASVLVTLGTRTTDAALMDALPSLGLVACYGTGHEGVDVDAANARGIAVSHGPAVNASSVADLAIALVLASVRRVVRADRLVRAGGWTRHPTDAIPVSMGLTGRRLGIWGAGEIGTRVARRAEALEMEVGYHGRAPRDVPWRYLPSLVELAAWADVLVVTVRAGAATRGAVDAGVLEALGPRGHLVNVSRGSVVDEDALLAALDAGRIAGAGLDVHAHEPRSVDALAARDDVVLTPHLGGATEHAQEAATALLVRNMTAFLDGRSLETPVPGSLAGRG